MYNAEVICVLENNSSSCCPVNTESRVSVLSGLYLLGNMLNKKEIILSKVNQDRVVCIFQIVSALCWPGERFLVTT